MMWCDLRGGRHIYIYIYIYIHTYTYTYTYTYIYIYIYTVDWDAVDSNCSAGNRLSGFNKRISSNNSNWTFWARWGFPIVSSPLPICDSCDERGWVERKLPTLLDVCVPSLRRGHANLPCIAPILTDDPRRESNTHCVVYMIGFIMCRFVVWQLASCFLARHGFCLGRRSGWMSRAYGHFSY